MIELSKLTHEDIGKAVWYKPHHAKKDKKQWEWGKIKSWSEHSIFVVYNANGNWDDDHWKDYTAAATDPDDLDFA